MCAADGHQEGVRFGVQLVACATVEVSMVEVVGETTSFEHSVVRSAR